MPLNPKPQAHGKRKIQAGAGSSVSSLALDGNTLQLNQSNSQPQRTVDLSGIGGSANNPGGSSTEIQYRGGATTFAGSTAMIYNSSDEQLVLTSTVANKFSLKLKNNNNSSVVNGLLIVDDADGSRLAITHSNVDNENNIWGYENIPMKFATNDTERMRILGNGNVGVGTTAPASKLEVASTSEPSFRLSHTAGSIFTDFYTNSAGRAILKPTNGSNTSNGLAIGPITPAATLHVYDDNKSTFGKPRVLIQGGSNNTGDPMLSFKQDSGSNEWSMGLDNDDSDKFKLSRSSVLHSNTALTIDGSNNVVLSGNLTVQGTTTTIDSTTLSVKDKNIEMGVVSSPTDVTADGGGIT